MADAEKTWAALFDPRKDYNHRFDDVVRFLTGSGWTMRRKGSHRIFTRPGRPYLLNLQPEQDGKAKSYQIRQIRRILADTATDQKMNTKTSIKDYDVRVYWDDRSKYYVAEVSEIPTCAADGATPAEALANLEETFAVLKEAYAEEKLSFPYPQPDLSISARWLAEAADIIKISKLAELSGIPSQTLASKLKRGTELSPGESRKIVRALQAHGLRRLP